MGDRLRLSCRNASGSQRSAGNLGHRLRLRRLGRDAVSAVHGSSAAHQHFWRRRSEHHRAHDLLRPTGGTGYESADRHTNAMIGSVRVSLEAIRENAKALRDLVAPARAAFVVKSNAYGHGLIPVARAVAPFADRLCVYAYEEAVQLQDAGIARPIFVMGPVESSNLEDALVRKFELALWDTRTYLRALCQASRARHDRATIHVKVN